jgi:hypothetical protein
VKVTVLTEDCPPELDNLAELSHQISDGDSSGEYTVTSSKRISARAAAKALIAQGSDPSFFQLTASGKELE